MCGHYAAVELKRHQIITFCKAILSYSERMPEGQFDEGQIVLTPDGMVEFEDCGVIAVQEGDLVDFGNGYENILQWCPADLGAPCFVCGRDKNEHVDSDYGPEGMCRREDLKCIGS